MLLFAQKVALSDWLGQGSRNDSICLQKKLENTLFMGQMSLFCQPAYKFMPTDSRLTAAF